MVNYLIDISLLVSGFLCGITGIVKWSKLILLLGLTYRDIPLSAITAVHDWSGLAVGILAVLHVLMHRKWITAMTRQALCRRGKCNE